jgi:hypothetical protein
MKARGHVSSEARFAGLLAALVLLGAATTGLAGVIPYTDTEAGAYAHARWWNNGIHESGSDSPYQIADAPPVAADTSFVPPSGFYNVSSSAEVSSEQHIRSDASARSTEYLYNTYAETYSSRYVEFIATADTQAHVAFDWALDVYAANRVSEFGWVPDVDAEASWAVTVLDWASGITIYWPGVGLEVDLRSSVPEEQHEADAGRFDEILPVTFVPGQRYGLTIEALADASSNSNTDATAWAEINGLTIEVTPEPSTLALLGSSALALTGLRNRRKR